jgi:iron(III) transport system substrate-binding protein
MRTRSILGLLASVLIAAAVGVLALGHLGCGRSKPRVVLYCAQDQEFAVDALADFTKQTGVEVAPKFDSEAGKSVMLYEELVREADRPRCDVHWNNEILSTIRLQRRGLLEPYQSPSAEPYPDFTKAKDHTWQAFAGRARVLIVNTKLLPEKDWPRSLFDLTEPRFKGRVAMAVPLFGSTATHAACLFEVLGEEKAKEFFRGLRANDVQLVKGNKQVAVGVGEGQFAVGMTDTDDAMAEVKAGRPVAVIFPDRDGHPDHPRMGTLFFPNTVALIRGGPNPDAGRRLIDFLLSAEVEKRLAESASHQIPLNPQVRAELPKPIETPTTVKPMRVDWEKAADLWEEAQAFLRKEIATP